MFLILSFTYSFQPLQFLRHAFALSWWINALFFLEKKKKQSVCDLFFYFLHHYLRFFCSNLIWEGIYHLHTTSTWHATQQWRTWQSPLHAQRNFHSWWQLHAASPCTNDAMNNLCWLGWPKLVSDIITVSNILGERKGEQKKSSNGIELAAQV